MGDFQFNVIDTNSIEIGLISLNPTDSLYYDVNGRSRHPFNITNTFVGAALVDSVLMGSVDYKFSPEFIFNYSNRTLTNLSVDFGDGNGLQSVSLNSDKSIYYSTTGYVHLKFIATFSDNTTITTFSSLKIFGEQSNQNQMRNLNSCNTPTTFDIWSKLSFQGYDESNATKGKGDVTIYHSKINNCDGIIRKPIIIIDGFDPGDGQKGYQLYDTYLNNPNKGLLGDSLRNRGYDLFILNFPTYQINGHSRDGGADYIERNARVLMALIDSVNLMKQGNEKMVIIGPSMGGLISRYALTYMEQNNMLHNTRLWISFDSPHLGANIPIGDQYWLDFYGEATQNENILVNRDKKIGSTAAKQMLVSHYLNNGNPHSFRNTFMNTLNALGFPNGDANQPFRKISLIDGSLGGTEINIAGDKAFTFDVHRWHDIDLWLFKVRYKTYTVASSRVYFTGSYGTSNVVFDGWYKFKSRINYSNTAIYTSGFDVAPGGIFDTQQQIAENGDGQLIHALGKQPHGGIRFKTSFYSVIPNHSFINTKSALAYNGSNQNLSENISERSLVCTGETPFDSYFGDFNSNREHVELWSPAVDYILKEIDAIPQLPLIKSNLSISGQTSFCTSASYTIPNLPSGTMVTWTANNPSYVILSTSGSQNETVQVTNAVFSAAVILTAEIKTNCSRVVLTKQIIFGPPVGGYITFSNAGAPAGNPVSLQPCERSNSGTFYFTDNYGNTFNSYDNPGYEFEIISTVNCDFYPDRYFDFAFDIAPSFSGGTATVVVKVKNNCGWSDP
ncbi:hypothetical protein ASE92_17230 [Pedobacter sp. Leaf41]|uniref:esterase/lipase family protein n=1 Tax=Pedobacter sp. Leaf41 TaxID=1736218 RepID=UPI00070276EB|nr:hypothetical protein [Pedobacter sp. Leaf41]KQN32349.1 hypothetical protein ASE92_17230 [Pedobacter sp. Leaf41]